MSIFWAPPIFFNGTKRKIKRAFVLRYRSLHFCRSVILKLEIFTQTFGKLFSKLKLTPTKARGQRTILTASKNSKHWSCAMLSTQKSAEKSSSLVKQGLKDY